VIQERTSILTKPNAWDVRILSVVQIVIGNQKALVRTQDIDPYYVPPYTAFSDLLL
jgi:hypothetical protein